MCAYTRNRRLINCRTVAWKFFGKWTPTAGQLEVVCMWRGGGHTDSRGKHSLVVDVALHPGHQMLDVFGRWHLRGPLVLSAVLPEILELVCGFHFWAGGRRAELGDRAVLLSRISFPPTPGGWACVLAGLSGCRNRPLPNIAQPVSFHSYGEVIAKGRGATVHGQPLIQIFALRQLHHLP
jgi:hypothetical protein